MAIGSVFSHLWCVFFVAEIDLQPYPPESSSNQTVHMWTVKTWPGLVLNFQRPTKSVLVVFLHFKRQWHWTLTVAEALKIGDQMDQKLSLLNFLSYFNPFYWQEQYTFWNSAGCGAWRGLQRLEPFGGLSSLQFSHLRVISERLLLEVSLWCWNLQASAFHCCCSLQNHQACTSGP